MRKKKTLHAQLLSNQGESYQMNTVVLNLHPYFRCRSNAFSIFQLLHSAASSPPGFEPRLRRWERIRLVGGVLPSPGSFAAFPWQCKQIQLTLIAVFSSNLCVCVKESLFLSSLYNGLISVPLNMVIHTVDSLLSPVVHETPTAPLHPSLLAGAIRGDLGSIGRGFAVRDFFLYQTEEGEGEVPGHNPIDHPCPIWRTRRPLQRYSR